MRNFFDDFKKGNKEDWEAQLISDLKGKDPSILQVDDQIEALQFSTFYHAEDLTKANDTRDTFPFTRGMYKEDNAWKNGVLLSIENEVNANSKALEALNKGADLLVFTSSLNDTNWAQVLQGIELEYIETHFVVHTKEEYAALRKQLGKTGSTVHFSIDFLHEEWPEDFFESLAKDFRSEQVPFCAVNSYKVQQCGANTSQEIAFSLACGHEYLVRLMNQGFTIDEAAACISFKMGVGAKYVLEIGKFRALRQGWSKIIEAYSPIDSNSYNCRITAVIGHLNKSLADPYTNLLRQTTEAMSALASAVDGIVVLPYDHYSKSGSSVLAERMALNISSILKEESFLDKVIDPLGGSYSLESVTQKIGEKAWSCFQELEQHGGILAESAQQILRSAIENCRATRLRLLQNGTDILIGVNKYPDPKANSEEWRTLPSYFGLTYLVLEQAAKMERV